MTNQSQIKLGVEAFFIKDDKILLGLRQNVHGAGYWALPGGHVEYGETILESLIREMQEELGVTITKAKLVAVTDAINLEENQHYLHASFLVEEYNGKITNMEPKLCSKLQYFPLNALPEKFYPPHQGIMAKFLDQKIY
jgi:ADP-ribose pyrophosphatase YjhB (NUDIX family)